MSFKKHHFSWKCSKFYLNIYPITFASFSASLLLVNMMCPAMCRLMCFVSTLESRPGHVFGEGSCRWCGQSKCSKFWETVQPDAGILCTLYSISPAFHQLPTRSGQYSVTGSCYLHTTAVHLLLLYSTDSFIQSHITVYSKVSYDIVC